MSWYAITAWLRSERSIVLNGAPPGTFEIVKLTIPKRPKKSCQANEPQ
jgi:hypothetical protein